MTGHYFQDWLLLRHRLELAPRSSGGRSALRAVGDVGSPLARPRHLFPYGSGHRFRSWPTWRRSSPVRWEPRGPVGAVLATERSADVIARPMTHRGRPCASILLRFANGARGAVSVSQVSAGRRTRSRWEIDGSAAAAAWDSEHTGPPVARPPRPAQRDPPAQPRAHDGGGSCAAAMLPGRSRRGLRRHVRGALSARSTRTSRRAGRPTARRTRRLPTATTKCWSATRSTASTQERSLGSTWPGHAPPSDPLPA